MQPHRRAISILVLIAFAELALLGFGLVPAPWNILFLFLNGFPLGMVFGLVMGFLEGRQLTEILAAGLCASFIVSSGAVKSVGGYVLNEGVSEFWMPFVVGLLFLGPLLFFVWMLTKIPPPSSRDVAFRAERTPMTRTDRASLFRSYAVGLSLLVGLYVLLTIIRSIRDDFAVEIWQSLGYSKMPSIFTLSEALVMFGVVGVNGAAFLIRDNRKAFFTSLGTCLGAILLACGALVGFAQGWLNGFVFMVILGVGFYVPYVAIHTTLFERLIAIIRNRANIGYLMYLADTCGYVAAVLVLLARNLFTGKESLNPGEFKEFFLTLAWVIALSSAVMLVLAWMYFSRRTASDKRVQSGELVAAQ
jgi:hypothetical protein